MHTGHLVVALILLVTALLLEVQGKPVKCPSLDPQAIGNGTFVGDVFLKNRQWAFLGRPGQIICSVSVFKYDPIEESWKDHQSLVGSGGEQFTAFGTSLFLSESGTLFVGANTFLNGTGALFVFSYNSSADRWEETQRLEPTIPGMTNFGGHVTSCNDTLVVGNPRGSLPSVHVYRFNQTEKIWKFWQLIDNPVSNPTETRFGASVSCSFGSKGNFIFVGDPSLSIETKFFVGTAYVLAENSGNQFEFHQQLIVPNASIGSGFGAEIRADSNGWLAVSSAGNSSVILFSFDDITGNFTLRQKLAGPYYRFGQSLSIQGTRLAIGALKDNYFFFTAGAIFIYDLNTTSGVWEMQRDPIVGSKTAEAIGSIIVMDGDQIISTYSDPGSALIFEDSYFEFNVSEPHFGSIPGVDVTNWNQSYFMAVNWEPFTSSDPKHSIKRYEVIIFEAHTDTFVYSATHENVTGQVLIHEGSLKPLRMRHNTSYFVTVSLRNCVSSNSEPVFVQLSPPQPGAITFPGNVWSSNSSITVKWTEFVDTQAHILQYEVAIEDPISNESVVPFKNVGDALEGNNSFASPSPLQFGQSYRIIVRGTNEDNRTATASHEFYLASIQITDIRNTTSNTTTLKTGRHASIKWLALGLDGGLAQIFLVDNFTSNTVMNISTEPAEAGSFDWDPVPMSLTPGFYRIGITASLNNLVVGTLTDILTIESGDEYILILQPNETSIWGLNHIEMISWETNGTLGSLSLDLFRDGQFVQHIGEGSPETDKISWFVPQNLTKSLKYRIKAQSTQIPSVVFSTSQFEIDGPKSLGIAQPALNASEYWVVGQSHTIRWTTGGILSKLDIRVILSDFSSLQIATGVDYATEAFEWTVPSTQLIGEFNSIQISCPKYGLVAKSQSFEIDVLKTIVIESPETNVTLTSEPLELAWNFTGRMSSFVIEATNEAGDTVLGILKQNVTDTTTVSLSISDMESVGESTFRVRVRSERYTGVNALSPLVTVKSAPSSGHSNGISWTLIMTTVCSVLIGLFLL